MYCGVFQASFERCMFFIICSVNGFTCNKKKYKCKISNTVMCFVIICSYLMDSVSTTINDERNIIAKKTNKLKQRILAVRVVEF